MSIYFIYGVCYNSTKVMEYYIMSIKFKMLKMDGCTSDGYERGLGGIF